jgi:hypothetical protein
MIYLLTKALKLLKKVMGEKPPALKIIIEKIKYNAVRLMKLNLYICT